MQNTTNQTLIIVPTYNEAENIVRLLPELLKVSPHSDILIVDDNSPDGTAKLVSQFAEQHPNIHLLNRPKKAGLAGAYIAGFNWGLSKHYEHFVQMDADFSHAPSDVPRLLSALNEYEMAIGSRYVPGGGTAGWTWMRKLISRSGNIYAQTLLSLPLNDLTGGFTASKRHVVKGIVLETIRSQGYAFQVEIKYRASRRGYKILEVPILFENRRYGYSKMSKEIIKEAAVRVIQMRNTVFV